ncbi:MAG: bifunctional indole-3-glycerol phosphate synthase/phosphoribosylanthranilate isomerase [Spirochaetaceae bacterium]|nr:bifunctional indole-3-glycerol phosphate synthase/phosphoribosylanthranilate isomerase [Spirochaetaceae bacterium]
MDRNNIIAEIVEAKKRDAQKLGFTFGCNVPQQRTRKINPFMVQKGVILEIKRASPSKGDIAPELNPAETARLYKQNGASAISCLTERNYFKGSLDDLMKVCEAVPDVAVLRKDFLIEEEEIDIAYRCGADAVLLIAGILSLEKLRSMTAKCSKLGIRALVEVRTVEDAEKVLQVKKDFADTIVCGVNSRNLKDFTIDLLVPAMLKNKLGGNVIFESGIETPEAAAHIAAMGFTGILLGEFAVRNPQKAGGFIQSFSSTGENNYGKMLLRLAEKIDLRSEQKPLVKICGLTRKEDVLLADSLGADFVGFVFADGFTRNVCGKRFDAIKDCLSAVKAFKVAVVTDPHSSEAKTASELVKNGILDMIQFHGIKYEDVPSEMLGIPHYFAVTSKSAIEENAVRSLVKYGEARILQDCRSNSYNKALPLWIAGGIAPENAAELLEQFHPELVDVSSGIEDADSVGIKNPEKMKQFFANLKRI